MSHKDINSKKLKKILVLVREVHIGVIETIAESKEDAIKQAQKQIENGRGDYKDFEYSHTLGTDTWTTEEIEDDSQIETGSG